MSSTGMSDSTSVLKAFSVTQGNNVKEAAPKVEKTVTQSEKSYSKTDITNTDKQTKGKVPAANIAFEEKPETKTDTRLFAVALGSDRQPISDGEGGNVLVLLNANKETVHDSNGEETLFNSKGLPLNAVPAKNEKGEFLHDADGNQVMVKIDNEGKAKYNKQGQPVLLNYQGYPIDLNAAPAKTDTTAAPKETTKTQAPTETNSKIPKNIVPALLPTGEPLLGPDGKQLRVKVDDNGAPIVDKQNQPELYDWEGNKLAPPEKAHTLDRIGWIFNKQLANQILVDLPKFIVKQVAKSNVKAALNASIKASEIVGREVVVNSSGKAIAEMVEVVAKEGGAKATVKALEVASKTLKAVPQVTGKTMGKVMMSVAKEGTKEGTEAAIKTLTEAGHLGKGIQAITMKEGKALLTKESTNFFVKIGQKFNPVTTGKAVGESYKAVQKVVGTEIAEKGFVSGTVSVAKKVGVGAAERTIQKGLEEGAQVAVKSFIESAIKSQLSSAAVEAVIKKSLQETAPHLTAEILEKVTTEAAKITLKDGAKTAAKYVAKEVGEKAAEKIASSAFQKSIPQLSATVIEKIAAEATTITMKDGSKAAAKYIAETAGKEAAEKIASAAFQKTIAEAVEKGTVNAVEQGMVKGTGKVAQIIYKTPGVGAAVSAVEKNAVKGASKVSTIAPYVGAAIGVAITAWDANHAYKLTKDPKVTKLSAGLAWATVGLDAVSVAANFSAVGAPIGWVATGLSVGTSIASDIYKYKK
jgi:hypothetical protein